MKSHEFLNANDIILVINKPQAQPGPVEPQTDELAQLKQLAGMNATTEPNEHYFPIEAAYPSGDDMHHSKNPADMRSDSVSLYPNHIAKE